MKVLVTGGGGFVGGAIIDQLLARDWQVRSVARGEYPSLVSKGVEVMRGDLADDDVAARAVAGCDGVFHVAAKAGVFGSAADYERSNVVATHKVVDAARAAGVTRLIYTSTPSVVHGGGDVEGVDESAPYPDHFTAPYPDTKARAEQYVLGQADDEFATVAIRPHLVWGPGDTQLVPRIIERARAGKVRFVGDGSNIVDTTFIDNAAAAHLNAFDRLAPGSPISGKAYFIAQDEPRPIRDIVNDLIGAAGLPPITKTISGPDRLCGRVSRRMVLLPIPTRRRTSHDPLPRRTTRHCSLVRSDCGSNRTRLRPGGLLPGGGRSTQRILRLAPGRLGRVIRIAFLPRWSSRFQVLGAIGKRIRWPR